MLNSINKKINKQSRALNFNDDSIVIMTRLEADGKVGVGSFVISNDLYEDPYFDLIEYLQERENDGSLHK